MALTLRDCARHLQGTLGGEPDQSSSAEIANMAGTWFTTFHGWKFLERQSVVVAFVSGQEYADLPANLQTVIDVQTTDSLTSGFEWTSLSELLQLRTKNFPSPQYYLGALSHHDDGDSQQHPRLELWPTPASDGADALTMFYRAGWAQLANDADQVFIPGFVEPAYIETLRAYARGWEEDDTATLDMRLATVAAGPVMQAAMRQDKLIQPDYGVLQNGIGQPFSTAGSFWRERTIGGPSA